MAFCVRAADILLPADNIDYQKFAVIACDQYTSEKKYWQELKEYINGAVSALDIILPEVFLKDDNTKEIETINANMSRYLNEGVFREHKNCIVYVERETPFNSMRRGIVAAVDLEAYSYDGKKTPVRSSEGTVLSRIPPRAKIRRNAAVELPHIMLLIDDEKDEIFGCLEKQKANLPQLYNTRLNMNGGSVRGYKIENCGEILGKLEALAGSAPQKYGNGENLFIAVGDGNHSLAAAKSIWEEVKKGLTESQRENHPARFALAEIVNIHDDGIKFQPIHRVFFVKDKEDFIKELKSAMNMYNNNGGSIVCCGGKQPLTLPENAAQAVKAVQDFADAYTAAKGGYTDYVHGENSVLEICRDGGAAGVLLPVMKKEDFFRYIIEKGSFPRKCFSMGEANEKRYYIEARKLF